MRLPKASDVVVSTVRKRILMDRLPVGHRLPSESDLADELGVGRVAVREALRLLERDGLVEIRRGVTGGVFVRHPDLGQISEAITLLFATRATTIAEWVEFRLLVEPIAAELAARNATPEQREVFRAYAGSAARDLAQVPDLHLAVAESSGNTVLATALAVLRHPFDEHFRPQQISEENLDATAAAHRRIAGLILSGDQSAARRAMTRHLHAYRDYMEQQNLMAAPLINLGSDRPPGRP